MIRILVAVLLIVSSQAHAGVVVIVNSANSNSIDQSVIKRIFTGKLKTFQDGSVVTPVNQPEVSPITEEFSNKILSKTPSQLRAYWTKMVFTGKGKPPKKVDNSQQVIELIKANPNMIGYVSDSDDVSGVKVLMSK